MNAATIHEDLDQAMGVPYFRAVIRGRAEYGVCPRCGVEVRRTPGAFGRHWEVARTAEKQARS